MVAINKACEETIVDYLMAAIDPLQLTASYYTGIGNVDDLQAPAVIVSANDSTEIYLNSNVWELFVNISVKEMAYDTDSGSLGKLAWNVQNCFWNPDRAMHLNKTGSWGFNTFQCQNLNTKHSVNEDILINELSLRIVGTITGSI